jgi:hypothetical protein
MIKYIDRTRPEESSVTNDPKEKELKRKIDLAKREYKNCSKEERKEKQDELAVAKTALATYRSNRKKAQQSAKIKEDIKNKKEQMYSSK